MMAILGPIEAGREIGDWHHRTGAWQPIESVDKAERVDLWVQLFEQCGEIRRDCWWDAEAAIPDWYFDAPDGPKPAASPLAHISHWKRRGDPDGPVDDGGPGLLERTYLDDAAEAWPDDMRARAAAYTTPVAADFDTEDDWIPW